MAPETPSTTTPPPSLAIWAGNGVFAEVAYGLRDVLGLIGWNAPVVIGGTLWEGPIWILIGATHFQEAYPKRYILYQMEQLSSSWITEHYLAAARQALAVWEFAPRHVDFWSHQGIECSYVPFSPPLAWSPTEEPRDQDIDVLFYGTGNDRRRAIQAQLEAKLPEATKISFFLNFDLFGEKRRDIVERSKIILNLHYYDDAALEVHRLNYLLALGKCVVSEWSSDHHLDMLYSRAAVFTPTETIANIVSLLLRDTRRRFDIERNASDFARGLPTDAASFLQTALARSLHRLPSVVVAKEED